MPPSTSSRSSSSSSSTSSSTSSASPQQPTALLRRPLAEANFSKEPYPQHHPQPGCGRSPVHHPTTEYHQPHYQQTVYYAAPSQPEVYGYQVYHHDAAAAYYMPHQHGHPHDLHGSPHQHPHMAQHHSPQQPGAIVIVPSQQNEADGFNMHRIPSGDVRRTKSGQTIELFDRVHIPKGCSLVAADFAYSGEAYQQTQQKAKQAPQPQAMDFSSAEWSPASPVPTALAA